MKKSKSNMATPSMADTGYLSPSNKIFSDHDLISNIASFLSPLPLTSLSRDEATTRRKDLASLLRVSTSCYTAVVGKLYHTIPVISSRTNIGVRNPLPKVFAGLDLRDRGYDNSNRYYPEAQSETETEQEQVPPFTKRSNLARTRRLEIYKHPVDECPGRLYNFGGILNGVKVIHLAGSY
jgi:hypothetical protein